MTLMKQSVLFVLILLFLSCPVSALSGKDYIVYSPNITDDETSPAASDVSLFFVLHGDEMAWENIWSKKNTATGDIRDTLFFMNISTNTTTEIYHVPGPDDPYFISPPLSVSGNYITWSEDGNDNIFLYNISEQKAHQVTTDGLSPDIEEMGVNSDPVVNGDRLVWAKKKPYGSPDNYTIVLENLTTGAVTSVSPAPGDQTDPAISGNRSAKCGQRQGYLRQ